MIVWWIVNTVSLSCYKDIGQKSLLDWGILNQILPLFRTNSVLFFFLFLWVLQWVALSSSHMISKIYTLHYILSDIYPLWIMFSFMVLLTTLATRYPLISLIEPFFWPKNRSIKLLILFTHTRWTVFTIKMDPRITSGTLISKGPWET